MSPLEAIAPDRCGLAAVALGIFYPVELPVGVAVYSWGLRLIDLRCQVLREGFSCRSRFLDCDFEIMSRGCLWWAS